MIVWNLNKFVDNVLVTHSEEELKELFAGQLSRRKMLLMMRGEKSPCFSWGMKAEPQKQIKKESNTK